MRRDYKLKSDVQFIYSIIICGNFLGEAGPELSLACASNSNGKFIWNPDHVLEFSLGLNLADKLQSRSVPFIRSRFLLQNAALRATLEVCLHVSLFEKSCLLLKKSSGNPYLKICDFTQQFVLSELRGESVRSSLALIQM